MDLTKYLQQNPKKHLIFDFDGTIFRLKWGNEQEIEDYRKKFWAAINSIDSKILKDMPEPVAGMTEVIANDAIAKHGDKAKKILFKLFEEKEQSIVDTAEFIQPIVDFIQDQHQNYTFHIWSSNMSSTFRTILEKYTLLQYFDILVGRDHVNQSKPNPEGFSLIYNPQFSLSDYLMIGDAERDSGGAKNAGIDFFLVK